MATYGLTPEVVGISCRVLLRGRESRPPGYPEDWHTLSEHLHRVRHDWDLSQRQAAEVIGCYSTALLHWEKGSAEPALRFLPGILRFLGYDATKLSGSGINLRGESGSNYTSVCYTSLLTDARLRERG